MEELSRAPDRFAWLLLQTLYERLGFSAEQLPVSLYDDATRRIVLPG
jgi:hypothetical protein